MTAGGRCIAQCDETKQIYAAPSVLKRKGDYLLTGAFSPKLVEQISQLVGECSYSKIERYKGWTYISRHLMQEA